MAGIVINSNFDVNQIIPLDSRLVATSSVSRSNITWKYEGMKVYQTDDKKTYLWNGATWSQETGGIYGGSGSLVGDIYVDTGVVGATLSNKSNILFLSSTSGTDNISFSSQFNRHTTTGSPNWTTVEVKNQFRWRTSSGLWKDGPYVSYNPSDINGNEGGLAFGTGDSSAVPVAERMRITPSGNVGIRTNNPKEYLQIGSYPVSFSGESLPLTIHKGVNAVIAYNWYYNSGDAVFDLTKGSSRISQSNGEIRFLNRKPNDPAGTFVDSLYLSSTGNVGINTTSPSYKLDVNGSIRSTSNITSVNTISDKFIFTGGNAQFSVSSSVISASASGYNFLVNKVSKLVIGLTNTSINTNASVGLSMSVTGNIISTGGSITNYEAATNLNSTLTYLWYSTNGTFGSQRDYFSSSAGGFTYTAMAYRVGALVHLSIEIIRGNPIQYGSAPGSFYGWAIRLSGQRFRPVNTTYGVGFGGWYGNIIFGPVEMSVFTSATGLPASTGDFYVQFTPYVDSSGSNGSVYRDGTIDNIRFRGSITYVAGV